MSMKPWMAMAIAAVLILSGCSSPEQPKSSSTGTKIPAGQARISGKLSLPEGADPADLAGAKVFVVGQESFAATTDKNGNYQISVDLGKPAARALTEDPQDLKYSIIAETSDETMGLKVDDIDLTSTVDKALPPIAVKNVGSISGTVTLQGKTEFYDILVTIPGTSYSASTDKDGKFTISNVPPGTYGYLRAKADGYGGFLWTDVLVEEGSEATVPSKELKIATGSGGGFLIEKGATYTRSKTVNLDIDTGDYIAMKISEDPNFVNVRLTSIQPTAVYTFGSDSPSSGPSTLYIEFVTEDGFTYVASQKIAVISELKTTLLSPADKYVLDTGAPEFEWEPSLLPGVTYEFQVSSAATFSPVDYQQNTAAPIFTPSLSLKDNTRYYWRVRTKDPDGKTGAWSVARSFTVPTHSVTVSLSTSLPPSDPSTNTGTQIKITYQADTLITVSNTPKVYDSFKWYLDGTLLATTGSTLRIGATLDKGVPYNLTVVGYIGVAPAGSTVMQLQVQ